MATVGKIIKCRAAVAWGPNKPLVMEEIDVAAPEADEIRIKIVATAVCHTDLYFLHERGSSEGFPAVLGHEAAGIVESVGSGVNRFKPGDTVIPLFVSQCQECRFCRNPKTNQCDMSWSVQRPGKRLDVSSDTTSRLKCRGQTLLQYLGTSTFSEYTVIKEIAAAKIPDSAPLDTACLLGCGVTTGYGAAVNTAKVEPGSTCAVFGLGAVGLAAVMGCKAAGASRIIAVDINKDKFPKAKVFGATDFVNPKDYDKPVSQVLVEMTNGGVDFALECVGNVDVMKGALESCVKGWGVTVVTGYNTSQDISARSVLLLGGRTLKGSLFGGYKSVDSVPKLVNDLMRGKLQLDEFVTKTLPLDRINEAFDLLINREGIRTVLNVSPLSQQKKDI